MWFNAKAQLERLSFVYETDKNNSWSHCDTRSEQVVWQRVASQHVQIQIRMDVFFVPCALGMARGKTVG
jgi:hypothetical protein